MLRRPCLISLLAALWLAGSTAASAAAPRVLTVPEIGEDDFRVSFSGTDGDSRTFGIEPRLAWNATRNEYLAVWQAITTIDGHRQVWAQRISATTGQRLGAALRVSSVNTTAEISGVDVVWNSVRDQYLVVWVQPATATNPEVFARRVSGTGLNLGGIYNVSSANLHGNDVFGVMNPAVTYSASLDEYLVAWSAAWDVEYEHQVWARRVSGAMALLGQPRRLSFVFGPSNTGGAYRPALTEAGGEYVVAYEALGTSHGLAAGETEIFVQRVTPYMNGTTPDVLASPEQRISDAGGVGAAQYDARRASIARGTDGQFLVVWESNEDVPGMATQKREIWAQRLASDLTEVGENDFRISRTGADSTATLGAEGPAVAYHTGANRFLVTWAAGPLYGTSGVGVRGQYVHAASGALLAPLEFPVSDEWPAGVGYLAREADAACGKTCLALWHMQEPGNSPQDEYEVWGQRLCAYAAGDVRYCNDCGPCQIGQGDCDSQAECRSGLTCAANVGANYGFPPGTDVCEDHCPVPLGDVSRCNQCGPCRWGEGDCDSDAECQSGLRCTHNVGGDFGWPASIDVCLFPEV